MKKIKTIEVVRTEERIDSIQCNMCGREENDDMLFDAFADLQFHFGYGTAFDGMSFDVDICDVCTAKLIKSMKIKPSVYSIWGEVDLQEVVESVIREGADG